VLDHFQAALEELDANAKFTESKAGRLDQHDQGA